MKKTLFCLFLTFLTVALIACGGKKKDNEVSNDASNVSKADSSVQSVAPGEETTADTTSSEDESLEVNESSEDESSMESALQAFCGGRFEGRKDIKLVALGDSIARGYGLENPKDQAFPALLSKVIGTSLENVDVGYKNYAVDGIKTSELLQQLEKGEVSLADADIVTLCIGANNILGPFMDFMGELGLFGGESETDTPTQGSFTGMFDQINALLESEEFVAKMNEGINTVSTDLPAIIDAIRKQAPDAVVAVMTVYSPYHGMNLTIPYLSKSVMLGDVSDKWVGELNKAIIGAVDGKDCVLVDTYDAFAKSTGMVNAKINLMSADLSFDPHPNLQGHIKLSDLFMNALLNVAKD